MYDDVKSTRKVLVCIENVAGLGQFEKRYLGDTSIWPARCTHKMVTTVGWLGGVMVRTLDL